MFRNFKYRIYPTTAQVKRLFGWLRTTRMIYNAIVAERIEIDRYVRTFPGKLDQSRIRKMLKKEHELPSPAGSCYKQLAVLAPQDADIDDLPRTLWQGTIKQAEEAHSNVIKKRASGEPAQVGFAKRHRWNCLRSDEPDDIKLRKDEKHLALPKIGEIRIKLHRRFQGRPSAWRILHDLGEWYVIISCNLNPEEKLASYDLNDPDAKRRYDNLAKEIRKQSYPVKVLPKRHASKDVGLDFNIKESAVIAMSTGLKVQKRKPPTSEEALLGRLSRKLGRQKKGSKRRNKTKFRIARLHRTWKRRGEAIDQTWSKRITERFKTIYVDDIQVKNLSQGTTKEGKGVRKGFKTARIGRIRTLIDEKAELRKRVVVRVPAAYTTRTCSKCGGVQEVKRDVTEFRCIKCDFICDRDVNAAINVLLKGRAIVNGCEARDSAASCEASKAPPKTREGVPTKVEDATLIHPGSGHSAVARIPSDGKPLGGMRRHKSLVAKYKEGED